MNKYLKSKMKAAWNEKMWVWKWKVQRKNNPICHFWIGKLNKNNEEAFDCFVDWWSK